MAFKALVDLRQAHTDRGLLDNSLTVKVGDVVAATKNVTAGTTVLTNATAKVAGNVKVYGVVLGFATNDGKIYPTSGQDPANTPHQITTSDTNVTTEKINAVVLPITGSMEFEADASATLGTTALSDKKYVYFDLLDCRTINESSVLEADNASAPLQFLSYGPSDGSTTKVRGRFEKRLLA